MKINESQLRDMLALRLDLIEPGLTLVGTNYPLPNSQGTRGYIDILARDGDGVFVVIELKRSNNTAREALHEIVKYTELLQREKGIGRPDIRAVIVSTEWAELLVPFSHFKRGWDNDVRGYVLSLDADGAGLASVEEVRTLQEVPDRGLTSIQLIVIPPEDAGVSEAWSRLTALLAQIGADDALGVELFHDESAPMLYLVLGRMLADDPRTDELDRFRSDVPDDTVEVEPEFVLEYRALSYIAEQLVPNNYTLRPAYPDKFEALTDSGGWRVSRVLRSGVFARQRDLNPDNLLLEHIVDRLGLSQVRFRGSARPSNRQQWIQFRRRIAGCLAGTDAWEQPLAAWFDECAAVASSDWTLHARIYNPCDFMAALVFGWPNQLELLVPRIDVAFDAPKPHGRMLLGFLCWNGDRSKSISEVVQAVYPEAADWGIARAVGSVWTDDLELVEALGLEYVLIEFLPDDAPPARLRIQNGVLLREGPARVTDAEWPGEPLSAFFAHHASEISQLVGEYRAHMRIDARAASVIVANYPLTG